MSLTIGEECLAVLSELYSEVQKFKCVGVPMQMASAEDELVSCQRVLSGPSHLWVLFRPAVGHGYLVFFPSNGVKFEPERLSSLPN